MRRTVISVALFAGAILGCGGGNGQTAMVTDVPAQPFKPHGGILDLSLGGIGYLTSGRSGDDVASSSAVDTQGTFTWGEVS